MKGEIQNKRTEMIPDYEQTIENYRNADFTKRLSMYMDFPELRNTFLEMEQKGKMAVPSKSVYSRGLNGMELLEKVIKGEIPHPSMAITVPMKLVKVEKGFAEFEAKADKNHLNPMGTIHGGFMATVLDSVTGCSVHSMLGPEDKYGTIDLNVKMFKPVPMNVTLKARANVIHCSKQLGVSEGTLQDDNGIIYAYATAICMILRKGNDRIS